MYRIAHVCQKNKLGEGHPDTINTLTRIAELLTDQGDRVKAELMRRCLIDLCSQTYGDGHPRTLDEKVG